MKTRVFSALGALAVGALAVGCSAETGPQGSGDPSVSETRSPLVLTNMTAARARAATCVVTNASGIDNLVVYGGESAAGTEENDTYIYNPASNAWSTGASTYLVTGTPTAMPDLTNAQMINVPGTDQCLLVGGSDGGVAKTTAFIYDLGDDTWTKVASLSNARSLFKLVQCGTGTGANARILAIGGEDNGTPTASIEMYTPGSPGAWSAFSANLSGARSKIAVASLDATYTKFIVAGGSNSGATSTRVDFITADSSCGTQTANGVNSKLSTGRISAVAFPSDTAANKFYVVGGNDTTNALATAEELTVTWNGNTSSATRAAGTSLTTATSNPQVALFASGFTRWAVVGGQNSAAGTALDKVQVWNPTVNPKTWATQATLGTARYDFSIGFLPSEGKAVVVGGVDASGTYLQAAESL